MPNLESQVANTLTPHWLPNLTFQTPKNGHKIPKRCPGLEEKQDFSLFNFHVQLPRGWMRRLGDN